jgi:hypothetical protein
MVALWRNLLIEQGATFQQKLTIKIKKDGVITLRPLDDYIARSQIRKNHKSAEAIATLETSIDSETSEVFWGLSQATAILLPPNCFAYQVPKNFKTLTKLPEELLSVAYVWDLEIALGTYAERKLQGWVLITPESTKIP